MHNFKCYEECEFDFNENKFIVITGNNGAGKTTIFSALVWGLYGTTIEGMSGDSVIRKKSGKDTSVIIKFRIDNDRYEVRAYRKHKIYKNSVILYKNKEDISGATVSETLDKIESILMPKNVFLNCLLFSKHHKEHFLDLSNAGRMEILTKILDLEKYDEIYKIFSENGKKLEKEKEDAEQEIKLIKAKSELEEKNYIENRKKYAVMIENFKESIKKNLKLLEEYKEELDSEEFTEEYIKKFEEDIKIIKTELEAYREKLSDIEREGNEEKTKLLMEATEKYNSKLIKIKQENSVENIKPEMGRIEEQIKNLKQEIDIKKNEVRNALKEETEKYDRKIRELDVDVKNIKKILVEYEDKLNVLKEKTKNSESERDKMLEKMNASIPTCSVCGQELKDEKHFHNVKKKLEEYDKIIEQYKEKIKELENKISNSKNDLKEKESVLEKMLKEKDEKINNFKEKLSEEFKQYSKEREDKILIFEKKYNELKDKFNNVKEKLEKLESELEKEKTEEIEKIKEYIKNKYLPPYKEVKNIIEEKKKLEEERTREYNNLIKEKMHMEKEVEFLKKENDKLEKNIKEFELIIVDSERDFLIRAEEYKKLLDTQESFLYNIKEKFNINSFWEKAFSTGGIKSLILDEVVPILNGELEKYSEFLNNLVVNFSSQKLTKKGELRNNFTIEVKHMKNLSGMEELSSGEKQMCDIVVMLCLRRLLEIMYGTDINIILADELLDTLDVNNTQNALTLLKKLSKEKCVILITHTMRDNVEADEIFNL